MLKAIHASENRKAAEIVTRMKARRLRTAAELVEQIEFSWKSTAADRPAPPAHLRDGIHSPP